jgi:hypothetical protein
MIGCGIVPPGKGVENAFAETTSADRCGGVKPDLAPYPPAATLALLAVSEVRRLPAPVSS